MIKKSVENDEPGLLFMIFQGTWTDKAEWSGRVLESSSRYIYPHGVFIVFLWKPVPPNSA